MLFHLSPITNEIYIHELDPSTSFKYSQSIQLSKDNALYQMQIVDNLLAVHNLDQKSSLLFDIKLAEYSIPICVENLDVDT